MSRRTRPVRRNSVSEPAAQAVALAAVLATMLEPSSPVGLGGVDRLVMAVAVWAVVSASATAPWWVGAVACGIGASIALDPIVAALGAVGFVAGLAVGIQRRDNGTTRAVIGGIAVNTLVRSELEGIHGLSALIGIGACAALLILGLRRRRSKIRRPAWIAIGGVGAVALLALVGFAFAAAAARPEIVSGSESARRALHALDDGDYERAADLFEQSAGDFDSVGDDLGGPLALPARLIPVVSQNARAGADLAEAAADGMAQAASSLRQIDPAELAVSGGAIDLDAVRAAEAPLVAVQGSLDELLIVTDEVRSPWLIDRLDRELDELEGDLARQVPRLANAVDAVRLAPRMLGGDVERDYLVLFTTPAEARGLGGFVGNYAEVGISDGQIALTDFSRRSDLERAVAASDVRCDRCPSEFLARYGRFGFANGETGGVADRAWSNITMPAHFPYVAEVAGILYPQSGGRHVDGVIVMDPYVVEALMAYTGPIHLPEFGVTVRPDEAVRFILRDQYLLAIDGDGGAIDNDGRIDALETLGTEVIGRLLTGELPEPARLAGDLAPLVAERRLLFWTVDDAEQELLDRMGLLGSIPDLGHDGGFSVAVTNAGASKIDVFLDRRVATRLEVGPDGDRRLIADVTLANNAPASGLPTEVIGNVIGLPPGTSRLWVSFYGPEALIRATLDGEPLGLEPQREAGWGAFAHSLTLGPGESAEYTLEFDLGPRTEAGGPSDGTDDVTRFDQPLATRHET